MGQWHLTQIESFIYKYFKNDLMWFIESLGLPNPRSFPWSLSQQHSLGFDPPDLFSASWTFNGYEWGL